MRKSNRNSINGIAQHWSAYSGAVERRTHDRLVYKSQQMRLHLTTACVAGSSASAAKKQQHAAGPVESWDYHHLGCMSSEQQHHDRPLATPRHAPGTSAAGTSNKTSLKQNEFTRRFLCPWCRKTLVSGCLFVGFHDQFPFLPRDAARSPAYTVVRCMSVCLPVCHVRELYRNK